MAVINLYRTATAYTAVNVTELGDITDWEESRGGINDNNLGGITGGITIGKWKRNGSLGTGTPLNRIDFGGASSIRLYANSTLNMSIYMDTLWSSGYKQLLCTDYNLGNIYMRFEVSNDAVSGVINRIYLARATVNGTTYLGFYVYNERESSGQLGQVGFYANSSWSAEFLEEAHFISTDNPYWGGGYSGPGGGDPIKQNWAEDSDFVDVDPLPDETTVGALASHLITIFSPTSSQMERLSELLWSKDFFDFVANAITNVEDLFVSFGMVPFEITGKTTAAVTWWNFPTSAAGSVPITYAWLDKVPYQFYDFDMGYIALDGTDPRIFASDSVLDYSPFSKLGIYLPFIGYQELDIDECRGSTLHLLYRIDILSGSCVAEIDVSGRKIYQFSGNCLTQLPLTSEDTSSVIGNAVNVGIAMASAGATGAIASAGDALTSERLTTGSISAAGAELQHAQHAAQVSNAEGSLAGATANGIMGMKPNYKKTGAISGAAAMLGVKQPYLFLTTPRQSMPEGYEKVCGFPCNEGGTLGSFTGFTVVEDIRLNGLVATSPEVEEIYQLLKSGVII